MLPSVHYCRSVIPGPVRHIAQGRPQSLANPDALAGRARAMDPALFRIPSSAMGVTELPPTVIKLSSVRPSLPSLHSRRHLPICLMISSAKPLNELNHLVNAFVSRRLTVSAPWPEHRVFYKELLPSLPKLRWILDHSVTSFKTNVVALSPVYVFVPNQQWSLHSHPHIPCNE